MYVDVSIQVPEELLSVKGTLRTLDLSVNRITILPPSIGEFNNLRTLNVSQNRLGKFITLEIKRPLQIVVSSP